MSNPEGTTSNVRVPAAELASAVREVYLVRLAPADAQGSAVRYAYASVATDGEAEAAFVAHPSHGGRAVVMEPPPDPTTDPTLAAATRTAIRFGTSPRIFA